MTHALLRLAVVVAFSLATPAFARLTHDEAKQLHESGAILPLERIIDAARALHAGRVVETELNGRAGRYIYEIEIVDEHGVVWEMRFDAATGGLIRQEEKDTGDD
jgi:uncharacterized membrane protein YkoI